MRIVATRVTPVRLPLHAPLVTGHGRIDAREGGVLEIEDIDGVRGAGEALPLPGFGLETPEAARAALEALAHTLVGGEVDEIDDVLDTIAVGHAATPSALGALDVALHDLAARRDALPLASWLAKRNGSALRERVPVGKLLAAETPASAAAEARAAVKVGFTTLKLKVGAARIAYDVERVAAVREAVGEDVALRLDANGAWSPGEACANVSRLAPLRIELLEQPVPAHDVEALARVRSESPFAIAADEALRGERAAEALLEAGAADVWVLKPAALGGLRPAARLAARASEAGVKVFVTSFLDSALGVCAALHLAATLPEEGPACGLATSGLLARDLAPELKLEHGTVRVPAGAGLGLEPRLALLRAAAVGPTRELRV